MNEIDLNDLAIKTDSLPDSWKMLLINPTTGLPAPNMTVARFLELFTNKIPEATKNSKGLMSSYDKDNLFTSRETLSNNFTFKDAIKPGMYKAISRVPDMPTGAYPYGALIVFNTGNPTQIYIPDPINGSGKIFVRQQWGNSIDDAPWRVITLSNIATVENLYSDTNNILTYTINCSPVLESNVPMGTLLRTLYQMKLNMLGRSTRSGRLFLNCRQRTNYLNKSSRLTA